MFGDFTFHPSTQILRRAGETVLLGGPARRLLAALLDRPGKVVSSQVLMERVWPGSLRVEANLRMQVTALRRVLEASPEVQRAIRNIPGRGYQLTLPVHQDGAAVAPPTAADEEAGRPPSMLTHLIGRASELGLLERNLEQPGLVTLIGIGGVGKTSLALTAARHWLERPGRRVRFLDLTTLSDEALLPGAVASAFGVGTPGQDPVNEITASLGDRETLLLLDNAEHLAQAAAVLTPRLLAHNPRLRVLATSRVPLEAAGERLLRLAPLAVPPTEVPDSLSEVMAYPAAELFVLRAAARLGGFRPRETDATELALLCRRLDGLPLAITLAASRIDMFGIAGLAAGMGDLLSTPAKSRRGTSGRHLTLRATLDWSRRALLPGDQRLLRRLAIFRGSFTAEAAMIVADGESQEDIARALSRLEAKSLLSPVETPGASGPRRRLLEITRAYAAELLAESGEAGMMRQRHAAHVLSLVVAANATRERNEPRDWTAVHDGLPGDLRVALDWAFGLGGDRTLGLRLITESAPIWLRLGFAAEYRQRIERALEHLAAEGTADASSTLQLHVAAGLAILHHSGEVPVMMAHVRAATTLAERIGDDAAAIPAIVALWTATILNGDRGHGLRLVKDIERRIPANACPALPLVMVHHRMAALTHFFLGDLKLARCHLGAPLSLAQRTTDTSSLGLVMNQSATAQALHARLLWLEGFPDQAARAANLALEAALAADQAISLCYVLTLASCPIAVWNGDVAAQGYAEQLVAISLRHRMPFWHGWGRCFESLFLPTEDGVPVLPRDTVGSYTYALEAMGTMHPALADPATIAHAEATSAGWSAPELLRAKAEKLLIHSRSEPGLLRPAERLLQNALALAETRGMRGWSLRCATSLARLWHRQGETSRGEDVLSGILEGFTEGSSTSDQVTARQLLHDMRSGEHHPARRSARG